MSRHDKAGRDVTDLPGLWSEDDYEAEYPDDFDDNEPVGSCDNCDSNIYESEDDGSGLCDQCQWYAAGCPSPDDSPDDSEEQPQ